MVCSYRTWTPCSYSEDLNVLHQCSGGKYEDVWVEGQAIDVKHISKSLPHSEKSESQFKSGPETMMAWTSVVTENDEVLRRTLTNMAV